MAEAETDDSNVQGLMEYCQQHDIHFHKHAVPRRIAGRGLGIYADGKIAKGERVVHVPTAHMLTTENVPQTFATAASRRKIPTHALLAAYFAFGPEEHLAQYQPWLATWPTYADFAHGTPLLWPEQLQEASCGSKDSHPKVLPAPLVGSYLEGDPSTNENRSGATTLISSQRAKLSSHIRTLKPILDPETYARVQRQGSTEYYKFIHAWLCVNTRCFSYTAHGKKRPDDPNEAMALCPGMDLFNHAVVANVRTRHDKTGYFANALRDLEADEEILFNYGQHVNDVLWAEYGFMLDENPDDAIRIDTLVLAGYSKAQKRLLEDNGYLNDYWLSASGVCYRSEVVTWLSILSIEEWHDMIEGRYDPESDSTEVGTGKRDIEGQLSHARRGEILCKSHRVIIASRVARIAKDAENALELSAGMTQRNIRRLFADEVDSLRLQDAAFDIAEKDTNQYEVYREVQAAERYEMCLTRWKQIGDMARAAESSILNPE